MDAPNPDPPPADPGGLQFDQAEYGGPGAACALCKQAIVSTYYAVDRQLLCSACGGKVDAELRRGSKAGRFFKAAAFGALAAALGSALYYLVLALTGYEFGLIAIVVGLMVGTAVKRGSGGRGGWAYQLLAMFLTYTAIVTTYIPFIVKGFQELASKQEAAQAGSAGPAEKGTDGAKETPDAPAKKSSGGPAAASLGSAVAALALAFVVLLVVAFIAPFLAGLGNILGLVILGIALYEAWKLNKGVRIRIAGPYTLPPPTSDPPPPDTPG